MIGLLAFAAGLAAANGLPDVVCFADGQQLHGDSLGPAEPGAPYPPELELGLAGARVRIPGYTWVLPHADPLACPGEVRWVAGRPGDVRIVALPEGQVLYGQEIRSSPGETEVLLLDRRRIYLPPTLVLDVVAPAADDPIIRELRRQRRTSTAIVTVVSTVLLGGFVAGAVYCPDCFILSGL